MELRTGHHRKSTGHLLSNYCGCRWLFGSLLKRQCFFLTWQTAWHTDALETALWTAWCKVLVGDCMATQDNAWKTCCKRWRDKKPMNECQKVMMLCQYRPGIRWGQQTSWPLLPWSWPWSPFNYLPQTFKWYGSAQNEHGLALSKMKIYTRFTMELLGYRMTIF